MYRLLYKPFFLCAALVLLASGCQSVKRSSGSPTWRQVTTVKRADAQDADPERAYAESLHHMLTEARIEHKVVAYNYGWDSNLSDIRRTSVIYRDTTNRRFQWWAMDQHLDKPVWLTNEATARQVSFLARRPALVVEEKYYPAEPDATKSVRPPGKPAPKKVKAGKKAAAGPEPAHSEPVPKKQPEKKAPAPAKPSANAAKPAAVEPAVPAVTKTEPKPAVAPTKIDGMGELPAKPKPSLFNKETSAVPTPKTTPKPKEPVIIKPEERGGGADQLAPPQIVPPPPSKEPKPIVPKPIPKLRTKPSELDVPKPGGTTHRRNFFQWLFALL